MLFFKLHSTETTGKFFVEISILKVDLQRLYLKQGKKESTFVPPKILHLNNREAHLIQRKTLVFETNLFWLEDSCPGGIA